MVRLAIPLLLISSSSSVSAFLPGLTTRPSFCKLAAKDKDSDEVEQKQAFPEGTIVEFEEKNREHVGKILEVERKANGAARYEVEEFPTGKHFNIADKEVNFGVPAPNNPKQVEKLLQELEHAHEISEEELSKELDITPELLEMAWEEAAEGGEEMHELTPDELIELVHAHKPNKVEKYGAWRLLRSELGHVFFKEIKENGRVVAFKPKPRSSVEATKDNFCSEHEGEDFYEELIP